MSFNNSSDSLKLSQNLLEEYKKQIEINKNLELDLKLKETQLDEKEDECDVSDTKINRLRQICHNLISRNQINDKMIRTYKNYDKILDSVTKSTEIYNNKNIILFLMIILILCIYISFNLFFPNIKLYIMFLFIAFSCLISVEFKTNKNNFYDSILFNKHKHKLNKNTIKSYEDEIKEFEYSTNYLLEDQIVDLV